jgi:eukaryotic-like serine/threonine-protein kinase
LSATTRLLAAALVFLHGCATSDAGALRAPSPISPVNGTDFDHFPRTTALKWSPVAGAVAYAIEIDCFHCCETGKWCTQVGESRMRATGIKDTTYRFVWVGANLGRWRVWALGPDGRQSEKSAWQDFLYKR